MEMITYYEINKWICTEYNKRDDELNERTVLELFFS